MSLCIKFKPEKIKFGDMVITSCGELELTDTKTDIVDTDYIHTFKPIYNEFETTFEMADINKEMLFHILYSHVPWHKKINAAIRFGVIKLKQFESGGNNEIY